MELKKLFRAEGFINGRAIASSKTLYREAHPDSVCVWNAAVISEKKGDIWFGDLDLTKDGILLKELSNEFGETLYVLNESDSFDIEKTSLELNLAKAKWNTTQPIPSK